MVTVTRKMTFFSTFDVVAFVELYDVFQTPKEQKL